MWVYDSTAGKLTQLSAETTVEINLLRESDELVRRIRAGATHEECVAWVNENF